MAGSAPTNRNRLRISTAVCVAAEAAAPAHPLERSFLAAVEADHLGIEQQFDIRRGLDPLDQIARHAGAEAAAADHHVNLAGMARQKHRGLPGGIAAADQRDLLLGAEPRLDRRGPVPDAAALEAGEVFDIRPAVARAARHHDGARAHQLAAVGRKRQRAIVARAIQRRDRRPGSASARRISAPGCRRGRPAPCRKCRWGSRDSFRSGRWRRPGRRTRGRRTPRPTILRKPHRRRWRARPDRCRPPRRRRACHGPRRRSCRSRRRWPASVGLRSTVPSGTTTSGRSAREVA